MNNLHKFWKFRKLLRRGTFCMDRKCPKNHRREGVPISPLPPATHPQRPKEGVPPPLLLEINPIGLAIIRLRSHRERCSKVWRAMHAIGVKKRGVGDADPYGERGRPQGSPLQKRYIRFCGRPRGSPLRNGGTHGSRPTK